MTTTKFLMLNYSGTGVYKLDIPVNVNFRVTKMTIKSVACEVGAPGTISLVVLRSNILGSNDILTTLLPAMDQRNVSNTIFECDCKIAGNYTFELLIYNGNLIVSAAVDYDMRIILEVFFEGI